MLNGQLRLATNSPDGLPGPDLVHGGELMIIPPGWTHGPPLENHEPARGIVMQILAGPAGRAPENRRDADPQAREMVASFHRVTRSTVYPVSNYLSLTSSELLASVCRRANAAGLPHEPIYTRHLALLCVTELARLVTSQPLVARPDGNVLFRKACHYIAAGDAKSLSVAGLARQVDCSPGSLIRLFRQQEGMTPIDYINRERVKRARNLLATTSLSIKQIAFQVGFSSTKNMARVFRCYTRVSPTEYRRRTG